MNPLRWPFRAQFFLGFLICAGLLGYAIFLQLKMGLEPCPLCIFQRLAFAALGLLFLIGALHGPSNRPGRATYGVLAFIAAAVGVGIAARHGLHPAQMAIAFCMARPFPCIPIIGATDLTQLEIALAAADVVLDAEILAEIDAAHRAHPMPY